MSSVPAKANEECLSVGVLFIYREVYVFYMRKTTQNDF